ncbi:MAG: glycosyltransferase [Dermatophilaceae bacterium]|nr:glycosyltransferase [Dermatophilaceae bacterium]
MTLRPDVSIVTTGHDVADARLHREAAALLRAGLVVEVLGLGDPSAGPKGASVRAAPRTGMLRRTARALVWPWRASGRVLLTIDPETVPSALLATRLLRKRLISDVHEDYVELLADRSWLRRPMGPFIRTLTRVVVGLAGRADLTVVADDHVPPAETACRVRLVLRNMPDLTMIPVTPAGHGDESPLRAVYVGDLRRSRGGREVVEALAVAPGWTLDLVGPAPAEEAAWLEERLRRPDVSGRVRWHGRQPPEEAWQVARGAHVGLALLADTPAFRAAIPTKVYEYLACGLAVITSPLPRVVELVTELGAGWVVDDETSAGQRLRDLTADRRLLDESLGAAARWSAELEAAGSPYDVLAERTVTLAAQAR